MLSWSDPESVAAPNLIVTLHLAVHVGHQRADCRTGGLVAGESDDGKRRDNQYVFGHRLAAREVAGLKQQFSEQFHRVSSVREKARSSGCPRGAFSHL